MLGNSFSNVSTYHYILYHQHMAHHHSHDNECTNFECRLDYWKLLVFLSIQTWLWDRKYVPRNSGNNGDMIYNLHVLGHLLMVIHNVYIA